MAAKTARFNSVNSEITGRKLNKFGKKSTDPSSVHKELSCGEKIAKIGPVYSEIFDKIRQFLPRYALLSAVYAVVVCLCVCVCHTPVLYQNG